MAELKPVSTSRFYVEFGGLEQKMIKSVTEITFTGSTAGHEKALASTKDGMTMRQSTSAGFLENPNFTIEVYLKEGDLDFYNWMKAVMLTPDGGDGKWSENRKSGSIVAYDSGNTEVLRWNFEKCWPKSYKMSDLNAESKDLAVETFEIVAESMVRAK
ncbi:phage tail protein [Tumidithrix elongata RA019]|uniref:Phage tail protein n=1 Tax=Tumidithrix elongata BACA0141 TaxID=2716417 RepID=A0AAW9PX19_9CYAN|nr:phage tail protein [Tumidithrix elongata RA019]